MVNLMDFLIDGCIMLVPMVLKNILSEAQNSCIYDVTLSRTYLNLNKPNG